MARIRSLKPEFWSDQKLARLPRDVRLLYIGLWNFADEHARLRGDARYVKGQVFPYDDDLDHAAIEKWLDVLIEHGRACRYEHDGEVYLWLPKLPKHQRLEPNKVPSRLPEPPGAQGDPDESEPRADKSAPRADESAYSVKTGSDQGTQFGADKSARRANKSSLKQVAGSKGQGVPTTSDGAAAPRGEVVVWPGDDEPIDADSVGGLVAGWLDGCKVRPLSKVIARVGREVKQAISEDIPPHLIREALDVWQAKGLDPSLIPSVINQVANSRPTPVKTIHQRATDDMFAEAEARATARMGGQQ